MGISLDKIVQDLLLIIRGSNISQSEPISKRQIEEWVHQYRAFLLKQDIDKGKMVNSDYVQELPDIELEMIEGSEDNTVGSDCYILRTTQQLPKSIDLNHESGLVYIGTMLGDQIQLIPYNRFKLQQYKKYTNNDKVAFLRNQYIYILNSEVLKYINIRGIFENPLEIEDFNSVDYNANYPMPMNMIPVLKEMILKKELGLEAQSFTDTKNDGEHSVSPNTDQVRYSQNVRR